MTLFADLRSFYFPFIIVTEKFLSVKPWMCKHVYGTS